MSSASKFLTLTIHENRTSAESTGNRTSIVCSFTEPTTENKTIGSARATAVPFTSPYHRFY